MMPAIVVESRLSPLNHISVSTCVDGIESRKYIGKFHKSNASWYMAFPR